MMLKLLTFNAALLNVRILGRSFHRPVDFIEARLPAIAEALVQSGADLVFLQEVFHHDYQQALLDLLVHRYPHHAGLTDRGLKFRLGNELLTLSRFPLQEGKLLRFHAAPAEEKRHTSKGFYHLRAELPGIGMSNLVNFHMSAGGKRDHPESTQMELLRRRQTEQLLDYCAGFDNVILAGDLNAGPGVSEVIYQQVLDAGYHDLFSSAGGSGISWDPGNPLVRLGSDAHLPPQRIDHIFANSALFRRCECSGAEITLDQALLESGTGEIPLSDHFAVSVRIATGNQGHDSASTVPASAKQVL